MQQATTTILSNDLEQSLVRLEAVAKLMDGAIVIPGTDLRIGLDAVIGMVPGIGDLVSIIQCLGRACRVGIRHARRLVQSLRPAP